MECFKANHLKINLALGRQKAGRGCCWFIAAISAILPVVATPVRALQVRVTPANPQLGDTLSVVIQTGNPAVSSSPTVAFNQKTYPAFKVAPNQFRAFLPTTPLEQSGKRKIRVSSEGQVKNLLLLVHARAFPVQRITLRGRSAGLKATKYELNRVAAFKQLVTPKKFWNGSFLKPNKGSITTIYGVRRYYNGEFAKDYYHRGVDYAGAVGSPVIAPAAGRVALVGRVSQGFLVHGNTIGIDHGQGVTSVFLHLSRINVKEGDFVRAGQVIGAVGSTGAVTGPHLHWGLYVQGESVDPVPWRNNQFK
jgi:murein DD-endopeptidase MepM/ murein hydrolase activator NlpD